MFCFIITNIGNKALTSFLNYRSAAKTRGYDFELTEDQFNSIVNDDCIYCGAPKELTNIGIDRIDNEMGYTTSNCVPCCRHCNNRKQGTSLEEWAVRVLHIRIMRYMKSKGFSYTLGDSINK